MKNLWRSTAYLLIAVTIAVSSCKKDNIQPSSPSSANDSLKEFVYQLMHYWYYWNDKIPDVNVSDYSNADSLLNAMLYKTYDKWSFMDKTAVVDALYNEGEYFGYGFYLGWDAMNNLRVIIVYDSTDAYQAGLRRGDIITDINGTSVNNISSYDFFFNTSPGSISFHYLDKNSISHSLTIDKKTVKMNGVLDKEVFNVGNKKTGYIVYDSFLGYSETELDNAFQMFKDSSITELIVDLRYNGGGYVTLAEKMADFIAPSNSVGKVLYNRKLNQQRSSQYDVTMYFKSESLNLNLNRVFFITSDLTASASELVINSLKPYMDVIMIGQHTYGKPVGMYGWEFQDYAIYPVTNQTFNAAGFGDYFDGLPVDKQVADDRTCEWGTPTEACLKQAIYYIAHGSFEPVIALKSAATQKKMRMKPKKQNVLIINR